MGCVGFGEDKDSDKKSKAAHRAAAFRKFLQRGRFVVRTRGFCEAAAGRKRCGTTALPDGWMARWNSSYRPVVWGVTISQSENYVLSIVAGEWENISENNVFSTPYRENYAFGGWALTSGGEKAYDMSDLADAPEGVTLYAIWIKN